MRTVEDIGYPEASAAGCCEVNDWVLGTKLRSFPRKLCSFNCSSTSVYNPTVILDMQLHWAPALEQFYYLLGKCGVAVHLTFSENDMRLNC